jgi:hypothetical protein
VHGCGRDAGECGGQAAEGGVPVDVLHRDRDDLGQHGGEQFLGRHGGRHVHGCGRDAGECGGQAAEGGVPVDVLHRDRGEVVALAGPGAELGHDHGVGAEVVEEVAVDRHVVDVQDLRQHLDERPLGVRGGEAVASGGG